MVEQVMKLRFEVVHYSFVLGFAALIAAFVPGLVWTLKG
jgi:hypothetical protein